MGTLGISESTAENTLRNLGLLALVDKEGKTTDRANNWRDDELYAQVCEDIRNEVYPTELLDIAQASTDRAAIESWFVRKTRIGDKAAKKNAAIFDVIYDGDLSKHKESRDGKGSTGTKVVRSRRVTPPKSAEIPIGKQDQPQGGESFQPKPPPLPDTPPSPTIHIDVQIHISPDAKPEQIDQIFASIAKHLYQPR